MIGRPEWTGGIKVASDILVASDLHAQGQGLFGLRLLGDVVDESAGVAGPELDATRALEYLDSFEVAELARSLQPQAIPHSIYVALINEIKAPDIQQIAGSSTVFRGIHAGNIANQIANAPGGDVFDELLGDCVDGDRQFSDG